MARILIAGAGYVGAHLGLELARDGDEVFALRRHADLVPAPLHAIGADLTEPSTLGVVAGAFDAVVYAAAADASTDEAYVRAYIRGLSNLLDVVEAKRVLFTSSTAVYAQSDGAWVNEESAAEAEHFSGRRLLEAEALLHERAAEGVVLRLGGIYGPEREGLLKLVRDGHASVSDGPPEYTNRFHRDDCAGALRHLLKAPQVKPLYLGVDDDPVDRRSLIEWLARELGAAPPPVVAAGQAQGGRRSRSNKRCKNERLKASGYRLAFSSYQDGYRALIA